MIDKKRDWLKRKKASVRDELSKGREQRFQASLIIEEALVWPICLVVLLLLIRAGIGMYDYYLFKLICQEAITMQMTDEISAGYGQAAGQQSNNYRKELSATLERRLILGQSATTIKQTNYEDGRVEVSMQYYPIKRWQVTVLPVELSKKEQVLKLQAIWQMSGKIKPIYHLRKDYFGRKKNCLGHLIDD